MTCRAGPSQNTARHHAPAAPRTKQHARHQQRCGGFFKVLRRQKEPGGTRDPTLQAYLPSRIPPTMWRIVQAVFLAVGFVVAVLLLAPHRDAGAAGDLYRSPMLLTPINCKLAARTLLGVSVSSRRSGSTGGGGGGGGGAWIARSRFRALALSFDFPDHPGFHWVNVSRGRSGLLVNTGQTFAINGQCERISGRADLPRCWPDR